MRRKGHEMSAHIAEELIGWLIRTEKRAELIYTEARRIFKDDTALAALLEGLAEDERGHHRMIMDLQKSAGLVHLLPEGAGCSDIDDALSAIEARLSSGAITKAELLEAAVALEFSEHNETFIYMVNALRGYPEEFSDLVFMLGTHKRRLADFLAGKAEYSRALSLIKTVPDVTKGRDILVVEDEAQMSWLFRVFLAEEGIIDHASNGLEALSMLEKRDYSAVISDIDMPVMNGIELFIKAEERTRGIGEKFLFITGSFEEEYMKFFEKRNAKYLMKPVSMSEVKKALSLILSAGDNRQASPLPF